MDINICPDTVWDALLKITDVIGVRDGSLIVTFIAQSDDLHLCSAKIVNEFGVPIEETELCDSLIECIYTLGSQLEDY